jgi:hypothetical protein
MVDAAIGFFGLILTVVFMIGSAVGTILFFMFCFSIRRSLLRIADALEAQGAPKYVPRDAPTLDKQRPDNWPAHEVKLSAFGR